MNWITEASHDICRRPHDIRYVDSSAFLPSVVELLLGLDIQKVSDVTAVAQLQVGVDFPGQFGDEADEKPLVQVLAHLVQDKPVAKGTFLDEKLQWDDMGVALEVLPVPELHQLEPV